MVWLGSNAFSAKALPEMGRRTGCRSNRDRGATKVLLRQVTAGQRITVLPTRAKQEAWPPVMGSQEGRKSLLPLDHTRKAFDEDTGNLKETTYGYGFDSLTLECENEEAEGLFHWQVDAQAFEKGKVSGSSAYRDLWCSQHPDRIMRCMRQYCFDSADVFVVLHHERARSSEE